MDENLPLVSIVTPSFNQGDFIEETIQSVLSQDYPNIEYWVIDGKSQDRTVEILRKYDRQLKWVSEPDKGQSDALNKGFNWTSGEILAWLCSDDTYHPSAVRKAVSFLLDRSDIGMIYGAVDFIDQFGAVIQNVPSEEFNLDHMVRKATNIISQAASFFRREPFFKVGLLDPQLHYMMDYDLWLRLGQITRIESINETLANARWHPKAKNSSQTDRLAPEINLVLDKFFAQNSTNPIWLTIQPEAYSNAAIQMAMSYYQNGKMSQTRKYLWQAIKLYPKNFSRRIITVYLRSLLGARLVAGLRWTQARRGGAMHRARLGLRQ